MSSFEELVNGIKNGWVIGSFVDCIYGTSKAEQRFAILITKSVWYALRVIMDDDHRQYELTWSDPRLQEYLIRTACYTKDEIYQKANEYKVNLQLGKFVEIYNSIGPDLARQRVRVMPSDCATNPDKYLHKGDLVQTDFLRGSTNHEGIYIGDGEVAHVSGHGDKKSGSVARIGKLLGDFVEEKNAPIRVVVYRLRFQTRDEIVQHAKNMANNRFRDGEYNFLTKNCQHFARLCTINSEECGDWKKIKQAIRGIVAGAIAGAPLFLIGFMKST